MKKIEAFLPAFVLDAVRAELARLSVDVVRVLPAEEWTQEAQHSESYQGSAYDVASAPGVLVVVCVAEEHVEPVIAAIQRAGCTDNQRSSRIFVTRLEQVVAVEPASSGRAGAEVPGRNSA